MSQEPRKRKRYNAHFRDDDPYQVAPKTTKWRLKRQMEANQVVSAGSSSSTSDHVLVESDLGQDLSGSGTVVEPTTKEGKGTNEEKEENDAPSSLEETDHIEGDKDWHSTGDNCVWFDSIFEDENLESQELPQETGTTDSSSSDDGDRPIYDGASITLAQSALLILSFALRHNITGECLADLLTLISVHCLATNIVHKTLYHFRAFFSNLKAPLIFHKYCTGCDFLLKDNIDNCPVCQSDLSKKSSLSYFVEIPLVYQIEQLFKRPEFHQLLLHRFSRKKKNETNIEDIYDGQLYLRHFRNGGYLSNKNNLSFMWYTDGVPLFKSSKISIWPIFLAINELPSNERMKQENMVFLGLWFGKSKPAMSSFLQPFYESLQNFSKEGISLFCSHCNDQIIVKGMLLCGTCDLPAKSIVMNMAQFNGKHGCPKCKQEGTVVKTGKGHTRAFPFNEQYLYDSARTHSEFLAHGLQAYETSANVFGVKGPSWWVKINVDIINGTAIDYMHTVLLGLVRKLLVLWFEPKFSAEAFSVSGFVNVADKRLSAIKPPYFIHRHPRSIADHSQYWKASECRAWLFYYSVPVMFGILKKEFFEHFLLFVEAMYLLNLDSISSDQLQHSEELIIKFCGLFSVLYGEKHMSANLHQILHLPKNVKELGPLWVYSCFSFESLNGKLVKLFHGTQNPVVQIANAVSALLRLPSLSNQITEGSQLWHFYNKLTSTKYHFTITETISQGIHILGRQHLCILNDIHTTAILQTLKCDVKKYHMFYRILFNGALFQSFKYNVNSRNSYTVKYRHAGYIGFGQIQFFVKCYPLCGCPVANCNCKATYLAIVLKIDLHNECLFTEGNDDRIKAGLKNVRSGSLSNQFIALQITDIIDLVVCVHITEKNLCVSLRPNNIEGD